MRSKLFAAGFGHRIRTSTTSPSWWCSSVEVTAGPLLHSLVLASPGQHHLGCFRPEECVLRSYFGSAIYTLVVRECWTVEGCDFVTLCKPSCSADLCRYSLKNPIALLGRDLDNLQLKSSISGRTAHAAEVLAQWGSAGGGGAHIPMVPLVEPLACLLAKNCWMHIGLLPRWQLPGNRLHHEWQGVWPAAACLDGHDDGHLSLKDTSLDGCFAEVEAYLLVKARSGDQQARDALVKLRCIQDEYDPLRQRELDDYRPSTSWSPQAMMDVALLASYSRNVQHLRQIVNIVGSATSCLRSVAKARLLALQSKRGGSLLPLSAFSASWALQVLDCAFMQFRSAKFSAEPGPRIKFFSYWTADSSPIGERNWMNCGFWQVSVEEAIPLFRIVQKSASGELDGDGREETLRIMAALKYHQYVPVQLGWKKRRCKRQVVSMPLGCIAGIGDGSREALGAAADCAIMGDRHGHGVHL